MNTILQKLGLTENESKIYIGFSRNPKRSAAQISRILHMDKSSAYKAVDSLLSKGLLIREGWKTGAIYSASSPDVLNDLYKAKEIELKNQKDLLYDFIFKLKSEKTDKRSTYISIEKGIEGLMLRMTESLESKEKLIRESFRHFGVFEDPKYIKFVKGYAKERIKKKIRIKELQSYKDRAKGVRVYESIMTDLKKYMKEQRDLPTTFKDKNGYRIWDNTATILSYDNSGEFIVLTIKDEYIVTLLKSMFDYIWGQSTPVIKK
ncbi:hypothetical protein HYV12_01295 [Candidatus Dojkabacteria bacterium]|nr:hypothetical protein [Candidatus Dojkabacteria bacterium]